MAYRAWMGVVRAARWHKTGIGTAQLCAQTRTSPHDTRGFGRARNAPNASCHTALRPARAPPRHAARLGGAAHLCFLLNALVVVAVARLDHVNARLEGLDSHGGLDLRALRGWAVVPQGGQQPADVPEHGSSVRPRHSSLWGRSPACPKQAASFVARTPGGRAPSESRGGSPASWSTGRSGP